MKLRIILLSLLIVTPAAAGTYFTYPTAAPLSGTEVYGPIRQNGQDVSLTTQIMAALDVATAMPAINTSIQSAVTSQFSFGMSTINSQVTIAQAAASSALASAALAQSLAGQVQSGGIPATTLGHANGPAQLDASGNYAGQTGEANNLSPAIYAAAFLADPGYTLKNAVASTPCKAITTITQNGSGGICQNWFGVAHAGDFRGIASGATSTSQSTVLLTAPAGLTLQAGLQYLVIDMTAESDGIEGLSNGNIVGQLSSVSGSTLTLTANAAYPVAPTDTILVEAGLFSYAMVSPSTAYPTNAYAQSNVALSVAPPAAFSAANGYNPAFLVDITAPGIFGRHGASVQIDAVSGVNLTLHFPLDFAIGASDRMFLFLPQGTSTTPTVPGEGTTGVAIGVTAQTAGAGLVTYGSRLDLPGFCVSCAGRVFDAIVQSERGAVNATTIIGEMQNNNHAGDNDFNYGFGMYNNGEFRNGEAYTVGQGYAFGSGGPAAGGWKDGFSTAASSNVSQNSFVANNDGAIHAFLDNGTHQYSFQGVGTPTVCFICYNPASKGYANLYSVDPLGNQVVGGNQSVVGTETVGPIVHGAGANISFEAKVNGALTIGQSVRLTSVGPYVDGPIVNGVDTQATVSTTTAAGALTIPVSSTAGMLAGAPVYDATTQTTIGTAQSFTATTIALAAASTSAVTSGDGLHVVAPSQKVDGIVNLSNGTVITDFACGDGGANREAAEVTRNFGGYVAGDTATNVLTSSASQPVTSSTSTEQTASSGSTLTLSSGATVLPLSYVRDTTNPAYIPSNALVQSINGANVVLTSAPTTTIPVGDSLTFSGAPVTQAGLPGLSFTIARESSDGSIGIDVLYTGSVPGLTCTAKVTALHR